MKKMTPKLKEIIRGAFKEAVRLNDSKIKLLNKIFSYDFCISLIEKLNIYT